MGAVVFLACVAGARPVRADRIVVKDWRWCKDGLAENSGRCVTSIQATKTYDAEGTPQQQPVDFTGVPVKGPHELNTEYNLVSFSVGGKPVWVPVKLLDVVFCDAPPNSFSSATAPKTIGGGMGSGNGCPKP